MTLFEQIVDSTRTEYEQFISSNPLFELIFAGRMQRAHYIAYLRETYHLVRHTSRALALAGSSISDDKRELRDWFFEQVMEENGHDLFCIKDLKGLGEDSATVLDGTPKAGAWGLITQNYYMAAHGNPLGILGVASATEGLGATFGSELASYLVKHYGIPGSATSFLKSHGGFDLKHLEDAKRVINQCIQDPHDIQDIIHARCMTFKYYGQLFLDVLNTPA